jgi:phospholipase/carboxylesterase
VQQPLKQQKNPPVLIYLHGYGADEKDLAGLLADVKDNFLTFSVRAPYTKDSGFSWFDVVFSKDNEINYEYAQVVNSRKLLLKFISQACLTYKADSTQIYLLGFSQGAIMAYEVALSAPDKIAGIIALSGRMVPETTKLNTDWKKASKLRIFIAHGKSDNVIRYSDSEKAYEFLKSKAVKDLTFKHYDMPHTISGVEVQDIESWLRKFSAQDKKK